jgi:thymidylate synthase
MNHYVIEDHPVKFLYTASKYILENGEKFGDIIECRNMYSELKNVAESETTRKMHEKFIEIFGDERLNWAKKVTFMEPTKEIDPLTDEEYYKYECLPKSEKRDSYFGRLIGECGNMERNQFAHLLKRLTKKKANAKTLQMVVFREEDIYNSMSQPCCISINIAPRNDILHISANWRSQALSKAGYADCMAIYEMGLFFAKESGLELGTIGMFAHSSHLRGKNGEMKKIKRFIKEIDGLLGINS